MAGAGTAFNEVTNNYLKHQEILEYDKATAQCAAQDNNACNIKKELEDKNKSRDDAVKGCEGNTSEQCVSVRKEVLSAYAEILRNEEVLPDPNYRIFANHTRDMADSTFAFGGQTAGAGKSLWSGEQDTIKGFGDAVAYVSSILTDELYILGGSKPALERQQDRGENMLRAAEILLNPAVVAQLSKAYREELARAYDSGDAERIGRVQGQGMGLITSLILGGGVVGTTNRVVSGAEDAAAAGKLGKNAGQIVEDGSKLGANSVAAVDVASSIQAARLNMQLSAEQAAGIRAPTSITSYSDHALTQIASRDAGIGVNQAAVNDAFANPVAIQYAPSKYGPTFKYIGQNATVVVNPQGNVVTTWGTSAAGVSK